MKLRHAFTLVELLVVIAIIAVLLTVLMPGLRHAKELGKRMRCGSNLRSIGTGMRLYGDMSDGRLPNLEFSVGTSTERMAHPYWLCRDFTASTPPRWVNIYGFGCLALSASKQIDNPLVFYCPADDLWKDIYKSYCTPGGWGIAENHYDPRYTNAGDASAIIRSTYVYYPETRKRIDAARAADLGGLSYGMYEADCPEVALKVADLDPSKAMSTDNGGHALGGSTRSIDSPELNKGHNALFGDGHVNFQRAPVRTINGSEVVMHIRTETESGGLETSLPYFMSHLQP
jgi:prepilin-type N-terminal cleavage/methylation domain-containing protein/prepilin-type processing-associated H-X9-DG protein